MKRVLSVTAVLLVCLFAAACTGGYTSKFFGVSFEVPETWGIEEDPSSICFVTPIEGADDSFAENVVYAGAVSLSESGAADLNAFADAMEITASEASGYEAVSRETAELAGMQAVILTYRCYSQPIETDVQQRMYLLCDGTDIYTVVYTATADSFSRYSEQADAIAASFKVK